MKSISSGRFASLFGVLAILISFESFAQDAGGDFWDRMGNAAVRGLRAGGLNVPIPRPNSVAPSTTPQFKDAAGNEKIAAGGTSAYSRESSIIEFIQKDDWKQAYAVADKMAGMGNAEGLYWKAMMVSGYMAKQLPGIEVNRNEGGRLFLAAAQAGDERAMAAVGTFYAMGAYGLPKDPKAAIRWSAQGRDLGNADAARRYYELTGEDPNGPSPAAHGIHTK